MAESVLGEGDNQVSSADLQPETAEARPHSSRIGRLKRVWLLLWPALLALHLFPIRSRLERELMLATLILLAAGGIGLYWRRLWVRGLAANLVLGILLLAFVPGATADPALLRTEYLRKLRSYEGTLYVWGGEAHTGIDCSGLVRAGMVDALAKSGVRELNPALLRQAIRLWWKDGSAREMGQGYGDRMVLVTETRKINDLDHALLQPGDVAVTRGGEHVMAYLGSSRWIEADPGPMRVISATAPGKLTWFNVGMRIMRWRDLAIEGESFSAHAGTR